MARLIKVRIPTLKREVAFKRFTTSELRFYLFDTEGLLLPDIAPEQERIEIDMTAIGEGLTSFLSLDITDMAFLADVAKILEVLYITVDQFESKVVPYLLKLDNDKFSTALFDLYRNAIMTNPTIDSMAFAIFASEEPMDPELERLATWLPEPVDLAIQKVIYKESWADGLSDSGYGYEVDSSGERTVSYVVEPEDVVTLTESEFELDPSKVRGLATRLASTVVGQEYAIDHVCAVARRVSAGFRDPTRPPAVMMFVGPTGVGKTLLAKTATEELFGHEAFGRIDCATLSERHDVSKLFGPPPGYVGYPSERSGDPKEADPSILYKEARGMESGGLLLLDEVEKAHPDIWDSFLTIFDEGYAKTSVGNTVDFRNVIIVMTSNLGSYELAYEMNKQPLGFSMDDTASACDPATPEEAKAIKETAMDAAKEYMKPELLGRLSAIVPFTNLSDEQLEKVVDLEWAKASEHIKTKIDAKIEITEELKKRNVDLSSGRGTGARFIGRLVDGYVVDPLADLYVNDPDSFTESKIISVDYGECYDAGDSVVIEYGPKDEREKYSYNVSMTIGDD